LAPRRSRSDSQKAIRRIRKSAPPARPSGICRGARTITVSIANWSIGGCRSGSPARTCRRSTTG
jgi:hypothetical protein